MVPLIVSIHQLSGQKFRRQKPIFSLDYCPFLAFIFFSQLVEQMTVEG